MSYSEHHIPVKGEIRVKCATKKKDATIVFKVVDNALPAILGLASCEELGLINRVQSVSVNSDHVTPEVFKGLGCLKNFVYVIDLIDTPSFKIIPARRIPYATRDAVKTELDRMVNLEVIKPISEPTPAVSPMVIVRKNNGKLRICMDPTELNKNNKRRHYPMKTVEEIAAKIGKSKFFTKLDCSSGFWQIRVSERTQKYLTFSTPWGRYSCLRIPFGISSAPEVFTEAMNELTKGLENVECAMDDLFIHAESQEQLNKYTQKLIERIQSAGLTLNKEKCVFSVTSLRFLGHIFCQDGIKIDPEKNEAIHRLSVRTDKKKLMRLLGMVTYLNKFIPNLSIITEPLRLQLKKDVEWIWESIHQDAFEQIKRVLSSTPVLRYYDVNAEIKLYTQALPP